MFVSYPKGAGVADVVIEAQIRATNPLIMMRTA
jgi:hypothetical protein